MPVPPLLPASVNRKLSVPLLTKALDQDAIEAAMAAIKVNCPHETVMVFKGTRYLFGEHQECYKIAKGEHVVVAYRNLNAKTVPFVILEV